MTTLRAVIITALAAVGTGAVNASSVTTTIGYTSTILGPTTTDITNFTLALPSFDPGDANSMVSNIAGNGYTQGVSMASLDAAGTTYTLTGYNISVKEVLTGAYTITNTSANSTAIGTAYVDTYTAVALDNSLAPPLTTTADPANDLYSCTATGLGVTDLADGCSGLYPGQQTNSIGGGPDAHSPSTGAFALAPGQSFHSSALNSNSGWVDYGGEIINNANGSPFFADDGPNENQAANYELTSGLAAVEVANPLTFYFSTATTTDTSVSGGNLTTAYATSVSEQVEVTYTFTATQNSATPEPATMVLMGGAFIGLGLIRKRLKKS